MGHLIYQESALSIVMPRVIMLNVTSCIVMLLCVESLKTAKVSIASTVTVAVVGIIASKPGQYTRAIWKQTKDPQRITLAYFAMPERYNKLECLPTVSYLWVIPGITYSK